MNKKQAVPTTTVVIPVFNGEKYLEEAIKSVLDQTYRDFEVVIVDDGSKDATWSIIGRTIDLYPDLFRGIRKENGGISSALNAGIRAAKGKYIAWLSHDDRFAPYKLEVQMDLLLSNPEIAGVYSDYAFINAQGQNVGRAYAPWYPQPEMLRHLLHSVFINGSTLVIERRCLLEAGLFDETLRYASDALMWANLVIHNRLAHIPEPLTDYRLHAEQTTTKTKKMLISRENQLWLRKTVETYGVQQIFPELNKPNVTPAELARAYTYFGDVFALRFWHTTLGLRLYWQAWRSWPSLRNPVLRQAPTAVLLAKVREFNVRKKSLTARNYGAKDDQPIILDMRPGHEVVKCIRFDS